ncbi:MAG TPA: hypothetical protein VGV07_15120 [Devosia sp.]|uniref:hypothetical protein n=1 Tax=Devosia sp. TaxID=1871048 RepID=UPI002DDDB742|nr:hypothetical protein [Devosia sp.]HEV2516586.1 hypothetical protein [Devosia sp.]
MLKLLAALGLAFALSAFPAMAQTDADTDAAVDSTLGDHTAYRAAFDAIRKAVADGDKAGFAAWVSYPIAVTADGEKMKLSDAAQFEEHYDNILTDEIKTAIMDQKWQDVFVNYQGIMYGNGQVWLNGICKDDKCGAFDVKVVTIQSTADITPKAN